MANRYRNQNYGRGGYGNRSPENDRGGYRSEYDRERYGSSDFGGGGFDYDREENYFGSGRQQYGQGYTGTQSGRGYGSYNRNFEDDYSFGGSSQSGRGGYSRGMGSDYDRGGYYGQGGYGGGEYGRYGETERGYSGRGYYGGGESFYGQGGGGFNAYGGGGTYGAYGDRAGYGRGYRGGYLESERGYNTEGRGYNQEDRGWWDRASDEVASWFGDEEAERRRRMDYRQSDGGQHRGRGPRNYKRSDDRISEDINDRLTDSYYLDASDVEVEVSSGEVVLTGTVDSRYAKRMAEDIAEDVSGVKNVENRIRVKQNNYGQSDSLYGETTAGTTSGTSGSSETTGKSRSKTASS